MIPLRKSKPNFSGVYFQSYDQGGGKEQCLGYEFWLRLLVLHSTIPLSGHISRTSYLIIEPHFPQL